MKQSKGLIQVCVIIIALIATTAFSVSETQLQQQRISIIKNYVKLLGQGNYKSIPKLFTKHAVAVSATGATDSINHFYETLLAKPLSTPQAKLVNIFDGQLKNNMMTAYYNMSWKNTKGELVSAKFVDLFIFQADSTMIKTLYVFGNSFHEDVFNG
jgi:nitrate reductase assembly molybdenum cofactor insertion protein NarJ